MINSGMIFIQFSMKIYTVGIHEKCLSEAHLMGTYTFPFL